VFGYGVDGGVVAMTAREQLTEHEKGNAQEKPNAKTSALKGFKENITAMQNDAIKNGTADMSMDDIDKISAEENEYEKYIIEKLLESKERAKDPNTKRYTHNEVWERIMARRKQKNV